MTDNGSGSEHQPGGAPVHQPHQQQHQPHLQHQQHQQHQQQHSPVRDMHLIADTVGLVPNIRKRDNLIQGGVVLGGTALLATIGYVLDGTFGALLGTLAGLVILGLITGTVIMVLGWIRAGK